jgi:hypothetical protein
VNFKVNAPLVAPQIHPLVVRRAIDVRSARTFWATEREERMW